MIQQIATIDRGQVVIGLDSEVEMCMWNGDAKTDINRHKPESTFKKCLRCNGYDIKCPKHQQYQRRKMVQERLF